MARPKTKPAKITPKAKLKSTGISKKVQPLKTLPGGAKPRMLKKQTYKSFRLHKRIKPTQPPLPSAFSIFKQSWRVIRNSWKLFLGISLVYIILTLILVRGFASTVDIGALKDAIHGIYGGFGGGVLSTVTLFGVLLGTSGSATASADTTTYQTLIVIMTCLATIWAMRQTVAQKPASTKDSFYKGMYPLVPFVLVLIVIAFQFIPLAIGSWLYTVVFGGNLAVTALEKVLWWIIIALFFLLTLYMVASSIFSLYIVALPDMRPFQALRSARKLVLHRRWIVARKVLFLPFILMIVAIIIMTPFLLLLPAVAEWVFFILAGFAWVYSVCYFYNLYRALLNE